MQDIIIIGGGACGFFTAINIAENFPNKRILILEKAKEGLTKVRISGGGRCNVTNAEPNISQFVKNYPRGEKELISAFHQFSNKELIQWFENKGVKLKIETDGRVFPFSNTSQSIINCFIKEAQKHNINILYQQNVLDISLQNNIWEIKTQSQIFRSEKIVITTGSNPKIWNILQKMGHTIIPPVPSLFTFNTPSNFIENLSGISLKCEIYLLDKNNNPLKNRNKRIDNGGIIAPLLLTHWGFSGPAILKLSAFGARVLAQEKYNFKIQINWLSSEENSYNKEITISILQENKIINGKKEIQNFSPFPLPKRLWHRLLVFSGVMLNQLWSELNKAQINSLAQILTASVFEIDGKSTFKEEFVTAGGVSLKEINFKTFESKCFPNLYLGGEVLDIDAITGGFNFQNAWTAGYIIAQNI
jgi:flavoprotein family protein